MSPKNGTNYLLCSYVNNRKKEDIQTHLSLKVTQSIWCFCHRIQLSSKELALHNFPKKIENFIKKFGENSNIKKYNEYCLNNFNKNGSIGTYCDTRWLSRGTILRDILKNIDIINNFLETDKIEGKTKV